MATYESGWLIEHGDSEACAPKYWTGLNIMAWSSDSLQALRFARQWDAETAANNDPRLAGIAVRIAEHGWDHEMRDKYPA